MLYSEIEFSLTKATIFESHEENASPRLVRRDDSYCRERNSTIFPMNSAGSAGIEVNEDDAFDSSCVTPSKIPQLDEFCFSNSNARPQMAKTWNQ